MSETSFECFTVNNWGIFPQLFFHDIVVLDKKVENGTGFMQVHVHLFQSQSNRKEVLQIFKQILNSYTFLGGWQYKN